MLASRYRRSDAPLPVSRQTPDSVSSTHPVAGRGRNCVTSGRTRIGTPEFRGKPAWHTPRFACRYNERMPGSDEMKPAGVKLTYDDFLLFPDDGKRHELID